MILCLYFDIDFVVIENRILKRLVIKNLVPPVL